MKKKRKTSEPPVNMMVTLLGKRKTLHYQNLDKARLKILFPNYLHSWSQKRREIKIALFF